jgi:phage terminase large subunit
MQRNGFPTMVPASKGAGSVEDGIALLKSYDIVVHPRCQHTIDELSMYSWKTDSLTGEILPQLEDKKNHIIDSLRYSLELLRNKKLPVWGAV